MKMIASDAKFEKKRFKSSRNQNLKGFINIGAITNSWEDERFKISANLVFLNELKIRTYFRQQS